MNSREEEDKILKEVEKLNILFEKKLVFDEQKDKIIDRLHSELQSYKEDLYKKLIKPILIDIIQVKSSVEKTEKFYRDNKCDDIDKILDIMSSFSLELGDILGKYEIRIYKSKCDHFVPQKQKIVKTINTNIKEYDKKIAKSYSYCYEMEGKIINPEKVAIYIYNNNEKLNEIENKE